MSSTATAPAPTTAAASVKVAAFDLTQRPPRSPHVRLGGLVILARTIDKGRAKLAGKVGEYHFDCPLDNRLFSFLKIDGASLLAQLAQGKGDGEILEWLQSTAGNKPSAEEIAAWSAKQASPPEALEARERLAKQVSEIAPHRTDIKNGFDRLDLDDYVSFGGKA